MKTLAGWEDCRRCARHQQRLGVVAPVWPPDVRVVVLSAAAPREAQAMGEPDLTAPVAAQVAAMLRQELGLTEGEVVIDHLVACGIEAPARPDEVAACSERFETLARAGRRPVIVVVGDDAQHLARAAGVDDNGYFETVAGKTLPLVVAPDADSIVMEVAGELGIATRRTWASQRPNLDACAPRLRSIIGAHRGIGEKEPRRAWRRTVKRRVTVASMKRHLRAEIVVAPLHPRKTWKYVVLDLDRHNPIQERFFEDTVAWVRAAFPNSLLVQSSASGGIHVYVKLPDGISYGDGARWLRAFVALSGRAHRELKHGRHVLRAEVVEVPDQPPRLPFGDGSFLLHHNHLPLDLQIDLLVSHVNVGPCTDFSVAQIGVKNALTLGPSVTGATRRRLDHVVASAEVGAQGLQSALARGDPWLPIIQHLDKVERHVVATGAPALGTRVRWTHRLAAALVDLVEEHEAVRLMRAWVHRPGHHSADILTDIDRVIEQTDEIVRDRYNTAPGVPTRIWAVVKAAVEHDFRLLHHRGGRHRFAAVRKRAAIRLDEAKATAFFLLKKFFSLGRQRRNIPADEFGQFVGRNAAHDLQAFLEQSRSWLMFVHRAVPGAKSREFALTASAWPLIPDEPSMSAYPETLPRRRYRA